MIITFCGHSSYTKSIQDEKRILDVLEKRVGDSLCDFYLGGYGAFDSFAYDCAKKFKKCHPNVKLIFVTPYLDESYNSSKRELFDLIVYPELEKIPKKYAISHRNKWMISRADIIIAYVSHKFGGAFKSYRYAKQKGKEIFNIADA